MGKVTKTADITIRGGLINVPLPTVHPRPPRHQPNTPVNKKVTAPRADYIPAPAKAPPHVDPPAAPPAKAPDPETSPDPEGITDEPAPTSQSD